MARQTSLFGKISGKLGAVVFATSGGETISREYNPNVSNPSTQAQVNQRARLKLMSQLSASLAPVLAMPKDGLVSSRNQFVKKNFSASYAANGLAQITYENLQLTNGNAGLPAIVATRAQESGITIQLAEDASAAVSRVVYIMYRKTSEGTLQLVQSVIVEAGGASGTFAATMMYTEGDLVFYAYGMKDLNANASAAYGNMSVANAEDVAKLVATRKVDASSYQFTQTRGATMYAGENEITEVPEGSARVYVTAFGGGSVSGGGIYEIGTNATVVASAQNGYRFIGWTLNGSAEILSTEVSYTFEVEGQIDLVATFIEDAGNVNYNVQLQVSSTEASVGTLVKFAGQEPAQTAQKSVTPGESVTVEAVQGSASDVEFDSWVDGTTRNRVSSANPYTFVPNDNVVLIARWKSASI